MSNGKIDSDSPELLAQKLRECERKLSAIADYGAEWESWLDREGRLLWVSPSVETITGYTVAECLSMTGYPLPLIYPEDREKVDGLCKEALISVSGITAEFRFVRKDGGVRWGAVSCRPVREAGETVTGHRSTIRDITAVKLSETERIRQAAINNDMTVLAEKIMTAPSVQDIADATLNVAKKLTGSRFGYVGYIDQRTGYLISPTLTRDIWQHCAVLGKKITFEKFAGLWGWVLTNRKPLMTNNPGEDSRSTGVPAGHLPIEKFLSVPAMFGSVLVGQIALANPPGDYEEKDLEAVTRLASIFALGISKKQAEEALHWSEERFKRLVTSVTDYIYTVNVENGKAVATAHGPGCLSITGYTSEEFEVDPHLWITMVKEEDRQKVLDQAETVLSSREVMPLEHRIIRKDGDIRWIRNTQVPRFDEDGLLVAYDGLITDITERKRTEEFIASILESIDEGFIVLDRAYRIISVNRAFAEQLGTPVEEILGRQCHCLIHNADRPCHEQGLDCPAQKTFATGERHRTIEFMNVPNGGQRVLETKSYPMRDNKGDIVSTIEILIDVTDKKRLEDQLIQAQKMESVGQLAGGVAHDFNNILTAIIGYCNLLEMKVKDNGQALGYAREILASAERAAYLTQSLLAFSRKQIIEPRPTEINGLVRRLEKMLRRLIGEDIEFTTNLIEKELVAKVDPGKIEQVLINLATNARDAMPGGGSLSIQTSYLDAAGRDRTEYLLNSDRDYGVIYVTDSGSGMSEETRRKIFEPFFTTKELGKGTGLGLSIVYGIINQHDGVIDIETREGYGTTFRIFLPLVDMPQYEEQRESPDHLNGGEEVILLGEDDPGVRMVMRKILESARYQVIEAVDGIDALAKFKEHRDETSLVLLDMIMPGMNGKEAHSEIVKIKPETRFIFMSGYTADLMDRSLPPGDTVIFLQKPVAPVVLLEKVRQMLDGRYKKSTLRE